MTRTAAVRNRLFIFLLLILGAMTHVYLLMSDQRWTQQRFYFHVPSTNDSDEATKLQPMGDEQFKRIERDNGLLKSHIQKQCEKLGLRTNIGHFNVDMLQNSKILVDDKHKLIYCQIAKVASTTWRRIFIMLSENLNITDPMSISANDAHHKYDEHLTYLTDLPPEEVAHKLGTYFKFLFVREPFERLVSAFRNKFVVQTNASAYFRRVFGRKIVRRYRRKLNSVPNGTDVKFEEFVKYLIDPWRKIPMNEHWEKFHNLCLPCTISYDFIGKLENFNEDSSYILKKNLLSEKVKIPSRKESRYGNYQTNSYLDQYYSKLPTPALKKLYKNYMGDFAIFNYSIPNVVKDLIERK